MRGAGRGIGQHGARVGTAGAAGPQLCLLVGARSVRVWEAMTGQPLLHPVGPDMGGSPTFLHLATSVSELVEVPPSRFCD